MTKLTTPKVELIPLDRIAIPNPRERDKKIFQEIVDSISKVGLKQPITVTRATSGSEVPEHDYVLVCGQGRIEAFGVLGQDKIPAIVKVADEEDRMLMGLIENVARRHRQPMELLGEIDRLSKRGYTSEQVARKIGVSPSYVRTIRPLIQKGEERLLVALEKGHIALNVAARIHRHVDGDSQALLAEIYEMGIRGHKLLRIKRLIEQRERLGKTNPSRKEGGGGKAPTAAKLIEMFEREAAEQRVMLKRAELVRSQLTFSVTAIRTFLGDENFITLLRAEQIETMPQLVAELVMGEES